MNVWDRLFRSKSQKIVDPEQLLDRLIDAHSAGNGKLLSQLCNQYQDEIANNFHTWRQVPDYVRADASALQHYAEALIAVAEIFVNDLNRPELRALLTGDEASHPQSKWETALSQASQLMDNLMYREATKSMEELIAELQESSGSGRDFHLAVAYGHLARCRFQTGEASKAAPCATAALQLCEHSGDTEGILTYTKGLYEINRYLGQGEQAADFAELHAETLEREGRHDEATEYRRKAQLSRSGEPLNRIIVQVGEEQFELEEAPKLDHGEMQFGFVRNRVTLHPCEVLTEKGKRLCEAGQFEDGLATLREAAQADVYDPDPHYQAGVTLVYLRRYAEAVASYATAEALAPGWFHCRAELWLARQLADGQVDHETFLALRDLEEDAEMDAEEKLYLAERELGRANHVPALYLHYGDSLLTNERKPEALLAYRQGLSCCNEPQVRTQLLVKLGWLSDNATEARACLDEAVTTKGDLISAAVAYLMLRDRPPKVH